MINTRQSIMNPEALFDEYQQRESGLITRRALLRGGLALGAGAAALTVPARAKASISALMCAPEAGVFGGSADGLSSNATEFVDTEYDYSSEVPDDGPGERYLEMINAHTHERYARSFVVDGEYDQDAIDEFSYFARDWRQNQTKDFDPNALQIVWTIWRMLGTSTPFYLNSGYRSPATNGSLKGAAKNSMHMHAKAMDLSHPSVPPSQVHAAAMELWAGGVGRYDTFTHVDSGTKRRWG
jgi:uncharacterized protein YcbK (DUF882 family)